MAVAAPTITRNEDAADTRQRRPFFPIRDTRSLPPRVERLTRQISQSFAPFVEYAGMVYQPSIENEQYSEMEEPRKWARTVAELLMGSKAAHALIREYSNLGRIEGREERKQLWSCHVNVGAGILLERAKRDTDIERLVEVSELLSDMTSPDSILGTLSRTEDARPEYYESLLRAIRWMERPLGGRAEQLLLEILQRLAGSNSVDIRETAYTAAACLPGESASRFLRNSLRVEPDQDAQEVINDVLDELAL